VLVLTEESRPTFRPLFRSDAYVRLIAIA